MIIEMVLSYKVVNQIDQRNASVQDDSHLKSQQDGNNILVREQKHRREM